MCSSLSSFTFPLTNERTNEDEIQEPKFEVCISLNDDDDDDDNIMTSKVKRTTTTNTDN